MVKKIITTITRISLIILLLLIAGVLFSQEENLSESITGVAEELVSEETETGDIELFSELLDELKENPVRINSADASEISRLFFLTGFQMKALVDYVAVSGPILSVYELANIPGFDRESAVKVSPFITLDAYQNHGPAKTRFTSTYLHNFSIKSISENISYPGPSWKMLSKYKFSTGSFSGGFTAEKDAGEKFLAGKPPLPDFISANLAYTGTGYLRKVIIGDFSVRFGQGTNINTGFRTSLSLTNPGFILARDELKPYTSTEENNFFRGVAAMAVIRKLAITVYASRNNIDATTGSDTGSDPDHIISFTKGGLHNTESLLSKKDAVTEKGYGINVSYNLRATKIGFAWSEIMLSLPLKPVSSKPEDFYDPSGYTFNTGTLYYNHTFRRLHSSGELSINNNLKHALVQALSLRPSDRLLINVVYRNYAPGFFSFHANGPGSTSSTSNARGLYGGFTLEMARHLFLSAGCDTENYPWLRYRCSAPSRAVRQEIRLKFMPAGNLTLEGIYNFRQSMVNISGENRIPRQNQTTYSTVKAVVVYSPSPVITLRSRVDFKLAGPSGSQGTLLLEDIICRFRRVPLSIWFRSCIFHTEDWDSRLYTYENDLLYSFSIPALYGKGSRNYLMIKWKISDIADLRIKYGITTKTENADEATTVQEIRLQAIIRL